MRISDWSSDVCSSDLGIAEIAAEKRARRPRACPEIALKCPVRFFHAAQDATFHLANSQNRNKTSATRQSLSSPAMNHVEYLRRRILQDVSSERSEEHTSELQSLMRISYAVFCLKKKKQKTET